jgi:hypothetical protein
MKEIDNNDLCFFTNLSRRTSRSQYRVRYGQPLGNDGVFVDLIVIMRHIRPDNYYMS